MHISPTLTPPSSYFKTRQLGSLLLRYLAWGSQGYSQGTQERSGRKHRPYVFRQGRKHNRKHIGQICQLAGDNVFFTSRIYTEIPF